MNRDAELFRPNLRAAALRIGATALAFAAAACIGACNTTKLPQPEIPSPPPQLAPQPQQVSPQRRAQLHTDLAAGYYERGQMDVALQELAQAVASDPGYAQAYNVYGLVYAVLGEEAKAQQSFQQALALAPANPEIHHNWGWYLCTHKRERESLAEFEAAVHDPLYKSPEVALVNAGRCAQVAGDIPAAQNYFRRALQVQPGNPLASYGLGLIDYKEGRLAEARSSMRGIVHSNNAPPEALYLGLCIERKLGDHEAELSYVSQLRNRYPNSLEAKAVDGSRC